jgi:serine/threonine protein kinase
LAESASTHRTSFERLPDRVANRYRFVRQIAKGGMGTVYEVEHEGTGERLALKVLKIPPYELDAATISRFQREARVSSLVKSQHIVRVIDAGVAEELGGAPFLVMDLLEGKNLGEHVADEPQPAAQVVNWLSQVSRALDRAHTHGVVHRDLKPENLFVTHDAEGHEHIKILDFGIAKITTSEERGSTTTGAIVGTPLYMAPEQASGDRDAVGPHTDVWAIGLIAFRLLTGRDYWRSGSIPLLLTDIINAPMKAPSIRSPRLSPEFDAWFLRSCDRDPSRRWPSVGQQIDALARALTTPIGNVSASDSSPNGTLLSAGSGARLRSALPSRKLSRRRITIGAAVLVGGITVGFSLWQRSRSAQERPAAPLIAVTTAKTPPTEPTAKVASPDTSARATQESAPDLASAAAAASPAPDPAALPAGRKPRASKAPPTPDAPKAIETKAMRSESDHKPRDPLADPD